MFLPRSSHLSRAPIIAIARDDAPTYISRRRHLSAHTHAHQTPLRCLAIMSGKPAIPEWQRASASAPASADDTTSSHKPSKEETNTQQQQQEQHQQPPVEAPTPTEEDVAQAEAEEEHSSEMDSLLEQASRFLEDPAIRDEPREKKAAFLESKGVSAEDIERLLGEEAQERRPADVADVGERVWAIVSIDSASERRQ